MYAIPHGAHFRNFLSAGIMNYFPVFRDFRDSLAPAHRDRRFRAAGTSADIPPEYFDYLLPRLFPRFDVPIRSGKANPLLQLAAIINVLFIKYYLARNI